MTLADFIEWIKEKGVTEDAFDRVKLLHQFDGSTLAPLDEDDLWFDDEGDVRIMG